MIKGSIQEEDITIINTYAPNIIAPQYVRQMLTSMKGEISNNTIIVGDFNTPLTPMDRSTKQKINKETQTLNDTIDQLELIDIYRTYHPKTMNFTFFSSAHRTFSRIDHILGHKCESESGVAQSCLTLCNPRDTRLLHPWDFLGKSTGVSCHFLLRGILPSQGLNPGLLIAGRFFTI